MADDKPKGAETESTGSKKKKKALLPIAIVGGLMLLEGAGVFFATRYMGSGPLDAAAGEGETDEQEAADGNALEISIIDITGPNRKTGRIFVYNVQVAARIAEADQEKVEELVKKHRMTLEDRLTNIIRASSPQVLQEDGLETMRRQFRAEINKVFNDENVIQEVLFPKFMPHRADY